MEATVAAGLPPANFDGPRDASGSSHTPNLNALSFEQLLDELSSSKELTAGTREASTLEPARDAMQKDAASELRDVFRAATQDGD